MVKLGGAPLRPPAHYQPHPKFLFKWLAQRASEFQMRILKNDAVAGMVFVRKPQFALLRFHIAQNVTAVIGAETNVFHTRFAEGDFVFVHENTIAEKKQIASFV